MRNKKLIFCVPALMCCLNHAMQERENATYRMSVIFNATALVKQNASSWWRTDSRARSSIMAERLGGWVSLISKVFKAFGIPPVQERTGRLKFFAFLNPIPIPVQCATVIFEGDTLPPIMAAWAQDLLDNTETAQIVNTYIDTQSYSEDTKEFYRALVYVTFDATVMEQTTYLDTDALEIVDKFKARKHPLFLIGICDHESYERLCKRWHDLITKFDRILFSHQIEGITPETKFGDPFWLHHLGISDQQNYIVVDDWIGPGIKGDNPPHYASNSKALAKIIKSSDRT